MGSDNFADHKRQAAIQREARRRLGLPEEGDTR
jgi:hypothetical protein